LSLITPILGRDRSRPVVQLDLHRVAASVRLDVGENSASVQATVEFQVGAVAGCPAFDLRQNVARALLDGKPVPASALGHQDLGAEAGAQMRVIDVPLEANTWHRLELEYCLEEPQADGARSIRWSGDGVEWDLWMSDLEPGRYLEQWLPANLCHDQFRLDLEIEVLGGTDHVVVANGDVIPVAGRASRWHIAYPPTFSSFSPLLCVQPSDSISQHTRAITVAGRGLELKTFVLEGVDADPAGCAADAAAWLAYLGTRYGAWAHGDQAVVVVWPDRRGMEYDGATTTSPEAMEHELLHSWFGRGVKPARACDGWIDEAIATWATSTGRASSTARFAAEPLALDLDPVVLQPAHPWSRHTPVAAYREGSRLISGLAHLMGGAGPMRAALAEFYRQHAGGFVTGESLERHLAGWTEVDPTPWWDRYVRGHA
jgi:hypothetical protein